MFICEDFVEATYRFFKGFFKSCRSLRIAFTRILTNATGTFAAAFRIRSAKSANSVGVAIRILLACALTCASGTAHSVRTGHRPAYATNASAA